MGPPAVASRATRWTLEGRGLVCWLWVLALRVGQLLPRLEADLVGKILARGWRERTCLKMRMVWLAAKGHASQQVTLLQCGHGLGPCGQAAQQVTRLRCGHGLGPGGQAAQRARVSPAAWAIL